MRHILTLRLLRAIALWAGVFASGGLAMGATSYVITNNDPGVSFYTVGQGGALSLQQQVPIGGFGNVAGFFGANRIALLDSQGQQCAYASVSSTGNIDGIAISTMTVGGSATGSPTDG